MKKVGDFGKKYDVSEATRVFRQRECWWVVFDCNGNAPADKQVVACASEELADEVHSLYCRMKEDGINLVLILDGVVFRSPMRYCVEGYDFDTFYRVKHGWAADDKIINSLDGLVKVAGFDEKWRPAAGEEFFGMSDGLYFV